MSYEIEIKAHVGSSYTEHIDSLFSKYGKSTIEKYDIYWSRNGEYPYEFRTRMEKDGDAEQIDITRKPVQSRGKTEINKELEFNVNSDSWDTVLDFFESLDYKKGRIKQKKGYHYHVTRNSFPVHVELLDVKSLGWFLEMEIICEELPSEKQLNLIQETLYQLIDEAGLDRSAVEKRGYNRMLRQLEK